MTDRIGWAKTGGRARRGLALALALALTAGAGLAAADDWAGYYLGIDGGDGSVDAMSIVPHGDGTYSVRVRSDRYSLCRTKAGGHTDGYITATGHVEGKGLVRRDVILTCHGHPESRQVRESTYTRDPETGILTLEAPDDSRKLYYHRISK